MSSGNPVFILPNTLQNGTDALAKNLFNSFTLGASQFCTKPGVVFIPEQPETDRFLQKLSEFVTQARLFTRLTRGIARGYMRLSSERTCQATLAAQATVEGSVPVCSVVARLFTTSLEQFLNRPTLAEEIFGPDSLIIRCPKTEDFLRVAKALDGHLTATLLGNNEDLTSHRSPFSITRPGDCSSMAFPPASRSRTP